MPILPFSTYTTAVDAGVTRVGIGQGEFTLTGYKMLPLCTRSDRFHPKTEKSSHRATCCGNLAFTKCQVSVGCIANE